jgi:hypothetical protein
VEPERFAGQDGTNARVTVARGEDADQSQLLPRKRRRWMYASEAPPIRGEFLRLSILNPFKKLF